MADHGYGGGGGGGGYSQTGEDSVTLSDVLGLIERRLRLIIATVVVIVLATFLYLGTRTPTYRASATLMLLDDAPSSGLLADLALVGSSPAAQSEMALLESRSLAVETIRSPATPRGSLNVFDETEPDSVLTGGMRRLGLTTLVQPQDLTPFSTLYAKATGKERLPHRLLADATGPVEPAVLRASFVSAERVHLRREDTGAELTADYRPDQPIAAFGLDLRLRAIGDFVGKDYVIGRPLEKDVVERVLDGLSVRETARNSGVIELTVSDSDPNRAAELANALCQNYILRSIRLGRFRASQTVEFVADQLTDQLEKLGTAESDVVLLQSQSPETIDVSATALALIERLSALELRVTTADLAQHALQEAIELFAAGEYEALARLSQEVPDLESLVFIEEIGRLTSESLLFERRDSGAFRLLLEQESALQKRAVEEAKLEESALKSALVELELGNAGGMLRLPDPTLIPLEIRTELGAVDAEMGRLRAVATDDHPDLELLGERRATLMGRITDLIQSAHEGLAAMRTDRTQLLTTYQKSLDELPSEERGKVDTAIATLGTRMLANLRSRLAGLAAQRGVLEERMLALENELTALPEAERRLADPMRRVAAYSEIVQFLMKSKQEAQLSEAATLPSAVLIDPAHPPRDRSSPKMLLSLVIATILASVFGLVLAFARQSLSGCMYTSAEVEEATGLPVFGAVPDFKRGRLRVKGVGEAYLPMVREPGGVIAEAYRSIRANLKFVLEPDRHLRTLAVTSCAPGEGKTTTNTDLAVAFALGGSKVLLVDSDFRRPTVHGYFGLQQSPGYAEAIDDKSDWRELVHKTDVDGLSVLTAGDYRGTPGEALSSERPGQLIDEFLEDYALVVFDLPPAIVVADVEVFAHKLDAIVLLYRSGGVPREALVTAVRRVQASGANLVGLILNAVRPTRTGSRSYYTYGYGRDSDSDKKS